MKQLKLLDAKPTHKKVWRMKPQTLRNSLRPLEDGVDVKGGESAKADKHEAIKEILGCTTVLPRFMGDTDYKFHSVSWDDDRFYMVFDEMVEREMVRIGP